MSQLKFWNKSQSNNKSQDKDTNGNGNGTTNEATTKNGKRNWLHAPDALITGHVVYLVKFFGNLPVDQPKGIEVVKDAIRKLQFAQQVKKAETGTQEKCKKLEITVSVNGVAIQEPRTQTILHQFPLHNISYCADEKGVKKFFSFIAKTTKPTTATNGTESLGSGLSNGYGSSPVTNGGGSGSTTSADDTHECFVFISNKLASDITLTIGQAFDLAYRKYMNANEKSELEKAQQQIAELQKTIATYKTRLQDVSAKLPKTELDALLFKLSINDITEVPEEATNGTLTNGKLNDEKLLIDTSSTISANSGGSPSFLPIVPPRNGLQSQLKSNSQKMDELLLNSDSDSDFDPRAEETLDGVGNGRNITNNMFGFEPPKSFGQQLFTSNYNNSNNNSSNIISNATNTNNNDQKLQNNNVVNGNNGSAFSASINNGNNTINNGSQLTAPLLAPPPKVGASRRSTSVTNNTQMNGKTDLFGSDPFDMHDTPTIFKSKMSIDDFSLESLDPLRK